MSADHLIVYPRVPMGRVLWGVGWSVIATCVILGAALASVDLNLIAERPIWMFLFFSGVLGAGMIRSGRKFGQRPILTADALGLWVGLWGQRQPWLHLDRISLRETARSVGGVNDMLVISPRLDLIPGTHSALGRLVARGLHQKVLYCGALRDDVRDIIAGLDKAAQAVGYRLSPAHGDREKVWIVQKIAAFR